MKIKEITQKKDKELQDMVVKLRNELTKTRFEVAAKETDKYREIRKTKKTIAQILTILREREIQREEEKDEKKA